MKFILGKKEYMTQLFDESGKVVPGTVVSAGPMYVLELKKGKPSTTKSKTGTYDSMVIGYGERNLKNVNKPQKGLIKKALAEREKGFTIIREFNNKKSALPEVGVGGVIDASTFAQGDKVVVSSISKGKGFQGVVKRHHFEGGRRSHGQKHSEREPGSIGAGGKQRVMPGMRMAGRMGTDRITSKNCIVSRVDADKNLIFIKGAIAGRKGTLVEIVVK
ncbi:MAG: 50S ribosomal protein L3 [Candidatus Paceibacterota bacterium]|jgi:large subunit ribosomal protein L3